MTFPISVLMPVYNGGAFLGKAIESILNQSFTDFEFIIINDGSKDGSKELIDFYAAKDSRIVVVHQENAGLITTLNRGIALAKAPLIARMDADDIALPERFEKQFAYMQANQQVVVLGTSIRLIDEHDQPIHDIPYPPHPEDLAKEMLRTNPLAHPTVMIRKSVIEQEGGYNPLYKHAEDYELWLRLSEKHQMANLPEILLLYRQHPHKVSFQHSQDQTLRTFVAVLASKARRQGKVDPAAKLENITPETLELFDLTDHERSEILFKTFEYTLNAHIFNRDPQPVLEIVEKAKTMAQGKQGYFLSMILQKVALFYLINKNYIEAFKYGLQALKLSPMAVFQTSWRISKKIAKRVLRKFGLVK